MFIPDDKKIENAACNLKSARIPLYEHNISPAFMERVTKERFAHLQEGSYDQKIAFFSIITHSKKHGL